MILDGCVEAGHPPPVYSINSGGLLLSMPSIVTSDISNIEDNRTLTDRQQEIMALLLNSSGLSTTEIHNQLASPPTQRWVRDELNKLKSKGYIDSTGNTTTKKWYIKK